MTIDERLEYIATLQKTHDEQIGKLFEKAQQTEEMVGSLGKHVDRIGDHVDRIADQMEVLTARTIQAMDAINRLARIADNHETRIEGLEGPPQ